MATNDLEGESKATRARMDDDSSMSLKKETSEVSNEVVDLVAYYEKAAGRLVVDPQYVFQCVPPDVLEVLSGDADRPRSSSERRLPRNSSSPGTVPWSSGHNQTTTQTTLRTCVCIGNWSRSQRFTSPAVLLIVERSAQNVAFAYHHDGSLRSRL